VESRHLRGHLTHSSHQARWLAADFRNGEVQVGLLARIEREARPISFDVDNPAVRRDSFRMM
jgi:hypothetical protein